MLTNGSKELIFLYLTLNFDKWHLSVHSALTSKSLVFLERIFFAAFWLLLSQLVQHMLSLELDDYQSQIFLLITSLVMVFLNLNTIAITLLILFQLEIVLSSLLDRSAFIVIALTKIVPDFWILRINISYITVELSCWFRFLKNLGSLKPNFDLCQLCWICSSRTVNCRLLLVGTLRHWLTSERSLIIWTFSYKYFESFWFSF